MGRIGLAVSPADPNVVYATIEAANGKGGVFRSTDKGATWERRNEFNEGAMYYGQIIADPKNADRIYVMSVYMRASDDGGKTLHKINEANHHGDNHALWIDPDNTKHTLLGSDGGVYESFDVSPHGNSRPTFPRFSSTTSLSTTRFPSTTFAAGRKTTIPGAGLRARKV